MKILDSQGWAISSYALVDYPSSPYEYLRKWIGKSFRYSDGSHSKLFTVEGVSTSPTEKTTYTLRESADKVRVVSERDLNAMVFKLLVPS